MPSLLPLSTIVGPRVRMTGEEAEHLFHRGDSAFDEHVELIDGMLIHLPPIGPDHAWITTCLLARFVPAYLGVGFVRCANPLELDEYSRPRPDLSVASGEVAHFRHRLPRADETLLVIEVSVSTLERDRA